MVEAIVGLSLGTFVLYSWFSTCADGQERLRKKKKAKKKSTGKK